MINAPRITALRRKRVVHVTRFVIIMLALIVIIAGCVLNPVDNPTLDGTTWEITSTVGGLSPSLVLDYVALNEKVIVTFGSGFGTLQGVLDDETRELDTFSFNLTEGIIEVTRGTDLLLEQEYVLVQNERRMRWNSVVGGFAYFKFKPY